ncbi:MAG: carbamoyltransferase HypF [Desulfitobacteriaceae bacterium]
MLMSQGKKNLSCWYIEVFGLVQGVGFRPFVYRLAMTWALKGWVLNTGQGVQIKAEGSLAALEGFYQALDAEKPSLAQITQLTKTEIPCEHFRDFRILPSRIGESREALIPPDLALCDPCRDEVLAAGERYHHYPFTNCTYCGPRFTVIRGLPYDRARTSMAPFTMCPDCHTDYHNPTHRRFHAQPTACLQCGPNVWLLDRDGKPVEGEWEDAVQRFLQEGKTLAVKGIGGFHLVCSALDEEAVTRLREAKNRPDRPLAVMARDLSAAERYCRVSSREREILSSPAAPILVLDQIPGTLPAGLAPHNPTLGVMLPYSPLHLLLFPQDIDLLVMTSGNARGLPIVKDNEEALRDLSRFADYFLLHDREIVNRCDDSVVRVLDGALQFYRRSRGYVPSPVRLGFEARVDVLGVGGEMKNTFCLLKGHNAFFSQHLGDMDTLEGLNHYRKSLRHFRELLEIAPTVVGYDPHPSYALTAALRDGRLDRAITGGTVEGMGNGMADGTAEGMAESNPPIRYIPIQHHHAHMVSAMADNHLEGEVIGVILDGTGYGNDGTLWGFEILVGGYSHFQRLVHLAAVPLPGGEQAVHHPWRVAVAYLRTALGSEGEEYAEALLTVPRGERLLLERMLKFKINTPTATSAGRLFDAVAALLGVCLHNTYDGQAAIELGELARSYRAKDGPERIRDHGAKVGQPEVGAKWTPDGPGDVPRGIRENDLERNHGVVPLDQSRRNDNDGGEVYPFELEDGVLAVGPMLRGICRDSLGGVERRTIAYKFHQTVAHMVGAGVREAQVRTGLTRVVLSGGVWQNPLLLTLTEDILQQEGLQVFVHRDTPANDGGLALGQAIAAYHIWQKNLFLRPD